jgi:hypothetical protein
MQRWRVGNGIPLSLAVELLPSRQGRFAVWLGAAPLRWIALCINLERQLKVSERNRYTPRVIFLSVRDLRNPRFSVDSGLLSDSVPDTPP